MRENTGIMEQRSAVLLRTWERRALLLRSHLCVTGP